MLAARVAASIAKQHSIHFAVGLSRDRSARHSSSGEPSRSWPSRLQRLARLSLSDTTGYADSVAGVRRWRRTVNATLGDDMLTASLAQHSLVDFPQPVAGLEERITPVEAARQCRAWGLPLRARCKRQSRKTGGASLMLNAMGYDTGIDL